MNIASLKQKHDAFIREIRSPLTEEKPHECNKKKPKIYGFR